MEERRAGGRRPRLSRTHGHHPKPTALPGTKPAEAAFFAAATTVTNGMNATVGGDTRYRRPGSWPEGSARGR